MKKLLFIAISVIVFCSAYTQERLKDYIVNSKGNNPLKYEWTGKSTQPNTMYTIRTITVEGDNVFIKEIIQFQGKIASETIYTCTLTSHELKTKKITSINVLSGQNERITEQSLLKLPPLGQKVKWEFIDERDGTKFTYSVKETTINNKKALELTEVIDGLNVTGYTYYVLGIGLYKKTIKDDNGNITTLMTLVN